MRMWNVPPNLMCKKHLLVNECLFTLILIRCIFMFVSESKCRICGKDNTGFMTPDNCPICGKPHQMSICKECYDNKRKCKRRREGV
jgi:hypothetical protein